MSLCLISKDLISLADCWLFSKKSKNISMHATVSRSWGKNKIGRNWEFIINFSEYIFNRLLNILNSLKIRQKPCLARRRAVRQQRENVSQISPVSVRISDRAGMHACDTFLGARVVMQFHADSGNAFLTDWMGLLLSLTVRQRRCTGASPMGIACKTNMLDSFSI